MKDRLNPQNNTETASLLSSLQSSKNNGNPFLTSSSETLRSDVQSPNSTASLSPRAQSSEISPVQSLDVVPSPSPRLKKRARKEQLLQQHKLYGKDVLDRITKEYNRFY